MEFLWEFIRLLDKPDEKRNRLFLFLNTCFAAAAGAAFWYIAGRIVLPGTDWLICFVIYPGFFAGYCRGILYVFNHESNS